MQPSMVSTWNSCLPWAPRKFPSKTVNLQCHLWLSFAFAFPYSLQRISVLRSQKALPQSVWRMSLVDETSFHILWMTSWYECRRLGMSFARSKLKWVRQNELCESIAKLRMARGERNSLRILNEVCAVIREEKKLRVGPDYISSLNDQHDWISTILKKV